MRLDVQGGRESVLIVSLGQFIESLSVWRRTALVAACLWVIAVLFFGGPIAMTEKILEFGIAYAILAIIIGSVSGAVLITESLRAAIAPSGTWTDATHLKVGSAVWMLLLILSVVALVIIENSGQAG